MTWGDGEKWNDDIVDHAHHDLRRWGEVTLWHSDLSTCWLEDLWRSDKLTCGKQENWLVTRWHAEMPRNEMTTTWNLRRGLAEKWHAHNMTCRELTNAIAEIPDLTCRNMKMHIWQSQIWEMTRWHIEKWLSDLVTCWEMTWWLSDLMRIPELRCN